jgi:DNA-binding response OmpR family regulator
MKRILVLDDDSTMRETIKDILIIEGHSVVVAANGKEGMNHIYAEVFDLIVTDVLMPDKDGIEVILEAKKKYPYINILAISGGGYISAENYLKMARDLGASASVMKPFDIDTFIEEVNSLLYDKIIEA